MTISIVQSKFVQAGGPNTGAFSLTSAPTAGNLLIAASCSRGSACSCTTGGLSQITQPFIDTGSIGSSSIGLFSVISNGSNSFEWGNGSSNSLWVWLSEWSGIDQLDGSASTVSNQSATNAMTMAGVAPNTAKQSALLLDIWGQAIDDGSTVTYTVNSGWTIGAQGPTIGTGRPWGVVAYQIVTPPTGAVSATATDTQSRAWGGIMSSFNLAADTGRPFSRAIMIS